jgi:hypothetical protein
MSDYWIYTHSCFIMPEAGIEDFPKRHVIPTILRHVIPQKSYHIRFIVVKALDHLLVYSKLVHAYTFGKNITFEIDFRSIDI